MWQFSGKLNESFDNAKFLLETRLGRKIRHAERLDLDVESYITRATRQKSAILFMYQNQQSDIFNYDVSYEKMQSFGVAPSSVGLLKVQSNDVRV